MRKVLALEDPKPGQEARNPIDRVYFGGLMEAAMRRVLMLKDENQNSQECPKPYSVPWLASKTGIPAPTLYTYFSGANPIPPAALDRVCNACGFDVLDLLGPFNVGLSYFRLDRYGRMRSRRYFHKMVNDGYQKVCKSPISGAEFPIKMPVDIEGNLE